jgi:hypothetical protein
MDATTQQQQYPPAHHCRTCQHGQQVGQYVLDGVRVHGRDAEGLLEVVVLLMDAT